MKKTTIKTNKQITKKRPNTKKKNTAKKKKSIINKTNIFKIILTILNIISYIILNYLLFDFKILSKPLFLIIDILYLILLIFINIYSYKIKKKLLKIILSIILILSIIINSTGIYYLNITNNFLDKIFTTEEYVNYYVITNKSYKELNELNNKKIGILPETNDDILSKLDIKYQKTTYKDYEQLYEALTNKEVDAIYISSTTNFVLTTTYENFLNNYYIIETIKIDKSLITMSNNNEVEDETEEKKESEKTKVTMNEINRKGDTFTVLITGIDQSGTIDTIGRSDVNMVVTINPNTKEVLLTSIPRDYFVQLHGTTGRRDKLTHAGLYSVDMSLTTIEDLLQIEIDYYVKVNFETVTKLVDELGGITVYSDATLDLTKGCTVYKGNNNLDGYCALSYSRERQQYSTGDRHRVQNQQEVIKGIVNKVESDQNYIKKYDEILSVLSSYMTTNIPDSKVKDLIQKELNNPGGWKIKTYNLNGYDSMNYTYTYGTSLRLYVMEPNYTTVANAHNYIGGLQENKRFSEIGL